jgi:hypothetical protein
VLVQASAGFIPHALDDCTADAVCLGVGQLGRRASEEIRDYWRHIVAAVGARRVVLTDWDDFYRLSTSRCAPCRISPMTSTAPFTSWRHSQRRQAST